MNARSSLLAGVSVAALILAATPQTARAADFDLNGVSRDITTSPIPTTFGNLGYLNGPDNLTNNGGADATLTASGGPGGNTYDGVISDGTKKTSLILVGPGETTLSATALQTYTGTTTINGGILIGGADGVFSKDSATTVNTGGTLDLGGFAQTINDLTLNGGTIKNGDLTSTGGIKSDGGTITDIKGSTAVTAASGTTTLTGSNTYGGATAVNSTATVTGANANAFSAGSVTTVNTGGTLNLGGFAQTINDLTLNGGLVTSGTLTGTISSIGGTIKDVVGGKDDLILPGNADLIAGIGTTTLSGNNSFTGITNAAGSTVLIDGTTKIDLAGKFVNDGSLTIDASGQLQFGNTAQAVGGQKLINNLTGIITVNSGGKVFDDLVNNGGIVDNSGAYVGDVAVNTAPGVITNKNGGTWTGNIKTNNATIINTDNGTKWTGDVQTNDDQITNQNKALWTGNVGTVTANAGTIINTDAGTIWNGTVNNANSVTNRLGAFWNGDVLANTNTGTISNTDNGTKWTGDVQTNDGQITNQNQALWTGNVGTVTANAGTIINTDAGTIWNGTVNNANSVTNRLGAFWNGDVLANTNTGTITNTDNGTKWTGDVQTNDGQITNQNQALWTGNVGTVTANAGTIINTDAGTIWNGTVNNANSVTNRLGAFWNGDVLANTNTGTIANTDNGTKWTGNVQSNGGTITNQNTATWTGDVQTNLNNGLITNTGNGTNWKGDVVTNQGTISNESQAVWTGAVKANTNFINNKSGANWVGNVEANSNTITNQDANTLWKGDVVANNAVINNTLTATWTGDVLSNKGIINNNAGSTWNSDTKVQNDAGGLITNAGTWNSKGTLTNDGTVTTTGLWDGKGTGTITNNAGAILNAAGTIIATTTNNGTFNVTGVLTHTGDITNNGTTNVNANLTNAGTFTNSGTMNVNGNTATVTTLAGNGNFTFTTDLSSQTTGKINATNVTSNGTANYVPTNGGNLLNGGFLEVIKSTNAPVGNITGGTKDVGLVHYAWGKSGNSFGWLSSMNSGFTPLASIASAQSVISSSFHTPLSNYVNSKANPRPNEVGCGTWGRAEGARFTADTQTSAVTGAASSSLSAGNAIRYTGLQGGFDCAILNANGTGWNSHFGFTVANVQANVSTSDNTPGAGNATLGTVDVDTTSFGLYAFFQNGGFTLDLSARRDLDTFKFRSQFFNVADNVNGGATGLSATGAYRFQLAQNTFLQPFGSLAWSGATMNQFVADASGSKFTISSDPSSMLTGRTGAQLSFVAQLSDTTFLVPFVAGSFVHNFQSSTSMTATQGGVSTLATTDGVRDYRQADIGLSLANSAINGVAYVKGTFRDGDMQGSSVSAGGRINF